MWLGATGWLIYREFWEQAGQPPPFTIDLAAEVGAQEASWDVLCDGRDAGSARTSVRRTRGLLLMQCQFSPVKLRTHGLAVKHLSSVYQVTPRGGILREVTASVTLSQFWRGDFPTEIRGRAQDGSFLSKFVRRGVESPQTPVAVAANGQVLNALHPPEKMAGLRLGRTWRIPFFNPLTLAALGASGRSSLCRFAEARVGTETAAWHDAQVPCWRVDYHEDGGRLAATTWVRISDGLVLRHEAHDDGTTIKMVRKPAREP